MRVLLLLALSSGCTEILRPVPWLKLKTTTRIHAGLSVPAGPGGLPHLASDESTWSYLYLRVPSEWKKIPIDPAPAFYVLAGGHSVLVTREKDHEILQQVLYSDDKTDGKPLPGKLLGIRASDSHMVFAEDTRENIDVREVDANGQIAASYAAAVSARDWWKLDGLTSSGVLAHAGASLCPDVPFEQPRHCRNIRCQVAELSPSGLRVLASAETCSSDWFPSNLAALRVAQVPRWRTSNGP